MFHKQYICILCKRRDCIEKVPHFQIKKKLSSEKTRVGNVVDDFIVDVFDYEILITRAHSSGFIIHLLLVKFIKKE